MGNFESLKKRKKELKLTNADISQRSGIALRTVEDIFRGATKNPRIDTMQAIERALGLDNEKNPPDRELSEGELALLELFNRIPEDKQEFVLQVIQVALEKQ